MERKRLGTLMGSRPGALRKLENETRDRDLETELRIKQQRIDQEARRTNRAYGNLDLDKWTEAVSRSKQLIPPPPYWSGRRRRESQ